VCTLIGGDFNARTEGGGWDIGDGGEESKEEEEGRKMKSKDEKINKEDE